MSTIQLEKPDKKIVQIGLNMISLLSVDDKEHWFEANVLIVSGYFVPSFFSFCLKGETNVPWK